MNEVDPLTALRMLRDFRTQVAAAAVAVKRRGQLSRILAPRELKALRDPLNSIVEYLSNSTDIHVISLLNKYPFEPTRRNLDSVAETTDRLIALFTDDTEPENSTE